MRETWWGKRARLVHGVLLAAFVVMLALSGVTRSFDDVLRDMRFQTLQRPATGSLIIVEIDAASLRALDTWPWPRSHYAAVIERLRDAGAEVVAFDVDFSSQSNAFDDERLSAVINASPDSVIVPAFLQQRRNDDPALYETIPQAGLAGDAVIANVNLFPESNGRVRHGLYQVRSESGERASLAAALAGAGPHNRFQIDYGVRPASIPRLSFADVIAGDFDPALVRGKRILVGATALELGDELAVPVHGILPGVVVHGLSYESIVQGRTIAPLPPMIALALTLALLGVRLRKPRAALSYRSFFPTLAIIAGAFVFGWIAQALLPFSLDLGIVYAGEAIWVFYLLLSEMQRRADALVEQREALLRHQAQHDPETALPNQRALVERVERLMEERPDARICVIVAGIDRLPGIRTAIGHQGANDVIRSLAARIEQVVGSCEPARLESSLIGFSRAFGKDENVEPWADCVVKVIGDSAAVAGANIDVSIKLGVAPRDAGQSPTALIDEACAALHAGRRRRASVTLYDASHSEEPQRRLSLMTDLLAAMDTGGLSVVYQPKQSLKDGAMSGAEALLRWHDGERGQVSPELFVTAAEETGHIRQLTKWTLCRIVRDSQTLAQAGAEIPLSFNLSAALLCNDAAIDELLLVASHSKLNLVAEITETMRIDDAGQAARSLERIRAAGIMLSIDDYGMGLSSLSYLRLIQANELKLDKSFTSVLMSSERDRVLIKSTIDLAHALDMTIAAEGVETEYARDMLRAMGCDSIQGYLYARPMTLAALQEQLAQEKSALENTLKSA